ncbi:hypothetical protein SF1_22290 [Sphingobacterium faecium NBRC 15299]|nr:hypothetical protein SF1_22290 [Sphingobacterium faecium NBRC 15299]
MDDKSMGCGEIKGYNELSYRSSIYFGPQKKAEMKLLRSFLIQLFDVVDNLFLHII